MGNFFDKAWETIKSAGNYLWNNVILGKDYTEEQALNDAKNLENLNNLGEKIAENTLPIYTENLNQNGTINSEDQKTIHEKFNALKNKGKNGIQQFMENIKGVNEFFNIPGAGDIAKNVSGESIKVGESNTNGENQTMIQETENKENNIADWQAWAEEQQKKQWEREDAIRRETQAREDNAISRAVQDARNAGINPNLMNINPAQAGGGITSATGVNTGLTEEQMQEQLKLLEQMIDNEFKADENQKDRLLDILGKIILFAGVKGFTK